MCYSHMGVKEDRYASGITQPTERLAMDGETGRCTRDGLFHLSLCSPSRLNMHDGLGFAMRA
ncbi:hypothetical protein GCM10007391_35160 [Alteromonas halophila]|uniref:Uncharacterized protein n=1 Tax=Alteromonas halophila TaxID=516698 RepID=A0A918N0H1_9ALTE|nr:hypothetical protein GCM10007391_35160 [Alteromonas halophila]